MKEKKYFLKSTYLIIIININKFVTVKKILNIKVIN
jgi:hypothetical protein